MIASVGTIAIAFDLDHQLGMTTKPRRLRAKDRPCRRSKRCTAGTEIDRRTTRLRGEVRAKRIDALQHRGRRLPLRQKRKLRGGRCR
jgi:hypothetical protein